MAACKFEYPEGWAWAIRRSDGALKFYIVTREGNRGSVVQKAGKILELRYNGKTLNIDYGHKSAEA